MSHTLLDDPSTHGHRSRLCKVLGLSRATLYRDHGRGGQSAPDDKPLRERIEQVVLDNDGYGYRRVTKQLQRDGIQINHKKVYGLMRRHNLLCRRKKRYVVTTDSNHGDPVYPNLRHLVCVCHPNQLWVADITYIRLEHRFMYLAVVLDAFSRRVVGWSLGANMHASLAVEALKMALSNRPAPLYHHSDRGAQYASAAYTSLLQSQCVQISMSRPGNPYDNAMAESFMKTLKYEHVLINDYLTVTDAKTLLPHFLEKVYNHTRLHSAIGYLPPAEFEARYTELHSHSPYLAVSP